VCSFEDGLIGDEIRRAGIEVEIIKKGISRMTVIPQLAKYMRVRKIDILHVFMFPAGFWGRLAAKLAGVPLVIYSERGGGYYENIHTMWIDRCLAPLTSKIVCNTYAGVQIEQQLGIASNRIMCIYNGIDLSKFETVFDTIQKRKEIGLPNQAQVVGIIANLHYHYKGHSYFLKSAKLIVQKMPDVRFLIIGDGGLKKQLMDLSSNLGVSKNVMFLGFRSDIPELLSVMDVLVLASLREGFSNAILEAMAAMKPVVATNVGGNPEVIIDGVTGLIVPPKDPHSMAQAILNLLQNEDLAQQMGEAGRRRVENHFTIDVITQKYIQLYDSLLATQKHNSKGASHSSNVIFS
jgi:glycosyltransferase involved in cell wall biosynthesis